MSSLFSLMAASTCPTTVSADDDAFAEIRGLVTVSGNVISGSMPIAPSAPEDQYAGIIVERNFDLGTNGTAVLCSDVIVENNDITGGDYGVFVRVREETISSMENTTLICSGDLVVRGNSITQCYEAAVNYVVNLDAYGYGEVTFNGAATFVDNIVEYADVYAFDVRQRFTAADYSEMCIYFPVCVSGNIVTDAKGLLRYDGEYAADDESALDFVGDVCVLDNVCEELDANMVRYNVDGDADDMASVLIRNALTVDGNTAILENDGVNYFVNIDASESASIEALMPLTVTCNTFTVGGSMVEADVNCSVWENATAVLYNDVLVQGNSVDNNYFVFGVGAPTGRGYSGYGLKLFQYLSVEADGVLASALIESEVLFDDNTIEGYNFVGMNVYRNADARSYYADAVACIVGDVTATNNVLSITGIGCGLAGGAEVDADAHMGNATATVDTLFCFSQNTLTMERGHGIVAYAEDDGYDYEDEYCSVISTLDLEYVIENNCITGIEELLRAPSIAEVPIGLLVDVSMGIPVSVMDNTFDMETGTAIVIESGEVTAVSNDIVVEYGSGIRITGGNVTVDDNCIEASVYGIYVSEGKVVLKNNFILMTQGTGVYLTGVSDAIIEDSVISGSVVGLQMYECFNITVARNVINNNDVGVDVDETGNLSFCNNWVAYNNQNGAQFYDCWNLWIEYNTFANNQGDGCYCQRGLWCS